MEEQNTEGRFSILVNRWRKLPASARYSIIAVVLVAVGLLFFVRTGTPDFPTAKVSSGEFVIDLKETGKLRAENSVTISSPPVRSNLQIVWLIPEGTQVEEGDILIRFDSTEIMQKIDDDLSQVDIAENNLRGVLASNAAKIADLESNLLNAQYSYQLAELRSRNMAFESQVQQEEGQLQLFQSELSLKNAQAHLVTEKSLDSSEVRMLKLKIRQEENQLDKSYLELEKLSIKAPAPGLVVYKETWKGSDMAKIKVGDNPWRGAALLEIPDLTIMLVETSVSEVDVAKVKIGQEVEVKLDAYPDPTFHGEVIEVAVLARNQTGSEAQVFDVRIRLKESDPVLRPGMTATAKIIVDRLPDKLWVPIEAVFDQAGSKVVYEISGVSWSVCPVIIGGRNDNFVCIESTLKAGDLVALVDPQTAIQASKNKGKTAVDNNAESEQSNGDNGGGRGSSRSIMRVIR